MPSEDAKVLALTAVVAVREVDAIEGGVSSGSAGDGIVTKTRVLLTNA